MRTMGTLEGTKLNLDLTFDGKSKRWSQFKAASLKWADSKNFGYMLEDGHGICAIFQAASATAANSKATGSGTISLHKETYKKKEIEDEFKKTSVITSVALAVRRNRKERLGASWTDAHKCGLSEDALTESHNVLDVKYLKQVNRTLARTLHDALFPGASRLRSSFKTPQTTKVTGQQRKTLYKIDQDFEKMCEM